MNSQSTTDTVVEEITIEAPAERIFEALTDPAQRMTWWNLGGRFRTTHMESDLRPGGKWLMRFDANGRESSVRGEYRTVQPPRVLEFTWLPEWGGDGAETIVRIDLEERAGGTMVRLTHSGFASEAARANHRGWPALLASLASYVTRGGT